MIDFSSISKYSETNFSQAFLEGFEGTEKFLSLNELCLRNHNNE